MKLKNFVIIVNSFLKKLSKNCMGFMKHLLPFLPKTLIMMMKSDVIIERVALPIVIQTIKNRQQAYNNDNSEDKEYAEEVLINRYGAVRDNGQNYYEQRDYCMKIELPSFNVNVSIEEYLDWVSEVEKFFNYMPRR